MIQSKTDFTISFMFFWGGLSILTLLAQLGTVPASEFVELVWGIEGLERWTIFLPSIFGLSLATAVWKMMKSGRLQVEEAVLPPVEESKKAVPFNISAWWAVVFVLSHTGLGIMMLFGAEPLNDFLAGEWGLQWLGSQMLMAGIFSKISVLAGGIGFLVDVHTKVRVRATPSV